MKIPFSSKVPKRPILKKLSLSNTYVRFPPTIPRFSIQQNKPSAWSTIRYLRNEFDWRDGTCDFTQSTDNSTLIILQKPESSIELRIKRNLTFDSTLAIDTFIIVLVRCTFTLWIQHSNEESNQFNELINTSTYYEQMKAVKRLFLSLQCKYVYASRLIKARKIFPQVASRYIIITNQTSPFSS